MDRSTRSRNKTNNSLRMKASSLYFLNDISKIDSTDSRSTTDNWRDDYTFNPMILGRGHFSKVYKVKCCSTGNTLAIKVIRRRRLGTDKIDEIMQEIEIMQILNKSSNSGYIQLFKVHTSPSEVGIVMEFASGGALFHVTQDSRTGLPEVYVKIILAKVLSALNVLHRQDIVHLDIKADNILLRYPYPSTDVALSDFGLARKLTKSKVHKEMIGTPDYIAPEVVNYEEICVNSDMWSVGVLTYFLLSNVSPFTGISKDDTLHKVTKTQYEFIGKLKEESMSPARTFISSLLVKIPEKRLSAEECLSHDFLSSVNKMEYSQEKSPCLEAPVINLEYDVKVRPNPGFRLRGMVMSQYDIDSSDIMNSEEDILKCNSVETLDNTYSYQQLEHDERFSKCIKESMHSIDLIKEDLEEKELVTMEDSVFKNHDEEKEFENYENSSRNNVDSTLNEHNNNNGIIEEDTLKDGHYKNHSEEESKECPEHMYPPNSGTLTQNSLNDMTILCTNSTDMKDEMTINNVSIPSEPCSITVENESSKESNEIKEYNQNETEENKSRLLIEKEICKDNNEEDEITNQADKENTKFQRTEIYESRRRNLEKGSLQKSAQVNESFRNSRENVIDSNHSYNVQHNEKPQRINSYNTSDSRNFSTDTLRSTNGMRRRPLSQSIKKDSDKPHFPGYIRRSEVMTSTEFIDGMICTSERNKSLSNSNLNISANKHKNKSFFSKLFPRKKSPKDNKVCIIS